MRILISSDVVGGVWRYTGTLVRELTRRGHSVAIAVLGDPAETRLGELPGVETFQRDLRLEWMPGGLADAPAAAAWLAELAGDWRADVVHLNQMAYSADVFPAPVLVVSHSDVLSWFDEVREAPAPADWSAYQTTIRDGLAAATAVAAPTAYQARHVARHYGRHDVRVIHNGIEDVPAEDHDASPIAARSLVLVAGRAWDEAKGIALLDRALGALGEDAPSVHLLGPLHGPSGESIQVENLVKQGEVDGATMTRFYRNTRLYVGPSLYEPFGLAPLEAAAHGCGLLLSGIGSFRELWTGAAAFFDPLTPEALAERLIAVLSQPEQLVERADRSLARARELYTAARMTDQYESLYRELISGASSETSKDFRTMPAAP